MPIQNIKIDNIIIEDSIFSLKDYTFEKFPAKSCLLKSFNAMGILYPVIVYKADNEQLHLIDGKKRVQFAKQRRGKIIPVNILPSTTSVTDIITLLFCNEWHAIESSAINKIQFICFAMNLGAPEPWILEELCIPFGFRPSGDFLLECERINGLSKNLRQFCHEKRFSVKQLLNLASHPRDVLEQIIRWQSVLQLTASTLYELASNLNDYLNRENKKVKDFLTDPDVVEIFESALGAREKTDRLRTLLNLRRFPILSETNARINKSVEALNLPKGCNMNWDYTLENKNISLSINLSNPDRWNYILDSLSSNDVKKAIQSILEEL